LPEKKSVKLKTFLDSSVPDFEIQQCLQEFSGYSLTRSTVFEKCLLLIGLGGNGKGVFIDIIRKMIGDEYTSNINLDSIDPKNTFNLIELYGKKINLAPDTNKCTMTSQGLLKSMISGETISVNQKFKDFLKFNPTAKWIIGSNFMLKFQDSSDGMARRLIIVPFNKQFGDGEKNLNYKSLDYWLEEDELSGVLNWAIQGYNRLIKNNKFTVSQISKKEIDNFKNYQNPIREFAVEHFEECSNGIVSSQEAYDLYKKFCVSSGIYNPLTKSQFTVEMKFIFKNMSQQKDATTINYFGQKIRDRNYLGIRLKNQPEHSTTQ
jgi:putative DNA primase/helicase